MVGQTAEGRVLCFECNPNKEFKALSGHLTKHAMSLDEYRQKWASKHGVPTDEVYVGWTVSDSPSFQHRTASGGSNSATPSATISSAYDPAASIASNLAASEVTEYQKRFGILFKQADEDPALETHIRDIVLGEIYCSRYQHRISEITSRMVRGKPSPNDIQELEGLNKVVMQVQNQNLRTMDSLNLTRAKKQKNQVIIESTPSRLVSAFEKFKNSLTPEQLAREEQDERESLARLHAKGKDIRDLAPVSLIDE